MSQTKTVQILTERLRELEIDNLRLRLEMEAMIDSPLVRKRITNRIRRRRAARIAMDLKFQN